MLNRLFPLKFKVRVSHFADDLYMVEYCHYRFYQLLWNPLFSVCIPKRGKPYRDMHLMNKREAIDLRNTINGIEDIAKYYEVVDKEYYRLLSAHYGEFSEQDF